MKPNLFDYATGELTNDAMICWMLSWSNSENERYKSLSQNLIRLFTKKGDFIVKSVNIRQQYKNIDIVVEVNDSEVIVIEDKVNTSHHSNQLERYRKIIEDSEEYKDYNIIFGNIYDLKTDNNKIYMYGEEVQAIYRYYPLDWFFYDDDMKKFIEPLSNEEYLINPGHTLITQSKAFFAVLHELINKGILNEEEEKFILKYIPYTSLEKDKNLSGDYMIKPYLSREGEGILMNYDSSAENYEECIFQDRINIRPLKINVYSTVNKSEKFQFPIIGAYITGDKISGLYTRMGDIVTDKNAEYISTYVD